MDTGNCPSTDGLHALAWLLGAGPGFQSGWFGRESGLSCVNVQRKMRELNQTAGLTRAISSSSVTLFFEHGLLLFTTWNLPGYSPPREKGKKIVIFKAPFSDKGGQTYDQGCKSDVFLIPS